MDWDERRILRVEQGLDARRKEAAELGRKEREREEEQRKRAGPQGNSYYFVPRNRVNC